MDRIRIGVLALQGDFAEHAERLREIGAEPIEIRLPAQLDEVDALIIPGGESTTITRLLDIYGLREPIRERGERGLPIWGTCAGAIVLAKQATDLDRPNLALMDIDVRRNAFGRQVDSFEEDLDIAALGAPPFHAVFIRAPIIDRAGDGVEVLARLGDGTIVAARERNLVATSFHPELTQDVRFHRLLAELAKAYRAREAAGERADAG
ncbi:MAG TPA: pyridoxal 5'-phosphate synthase glutaminase subunit PdxT [Vicinamibacterales bacterium]|nr:pyridoxal 5'-phosphate synthase glutaminase subunit PdxT [Vicinamibacterales bacterium]